MAKDKDKQKNQKKKDEPEIAVGWTSNLKDETKKSIFAVCAIVLAIFFTLAAFGKGGAIGQTTYHIFNLLFGAGFFLIPLIFFIAAIVLFFSIETNFLSHTIIGCVLFLLGGLGLLDIIIKPQTGGYVGYAVSSPFLKLFDFWTSLVIFTAVLVVSFLIMLNTAIKISLPKFGKRGQEDKDQKEPQINVGVKVADDKKQEKGNKKEKENDDDGDDASPSRTLKEILTGKKERPEKIKIKNEFTPPPLELLESDKGKPSSGDIKANSNIIKRTLQNFGIEVEMGEINVGPSVTQYTLKPAEGIKLSRILGLQNDLSLALAAHPLRIEAPIPGRPLVGIEVPNSAKTILGLAPMFSDEQFKGSPLPLLMALGRDVTGKPTYINLAKMPHALIAGATGAGKSICIHAIIASFLYRNSPESLRFIMIDPKRVELTVYNKIPHLLSPVITTAKKAILALKWCCQEMDRRYDELLKSGVRDILSYHEKHGNYNSMPYIVVIIDELADIMSTYPREMEAVIVRLAQMSRAVGIHLMLSTQRPSVEIITGLIKANIPCRVALQVASQIDSRTILDTAGAEKLLGSGDMLFIAGNTSKPKRLQGPFISEKEVKRVVDYLAEEYADSDFEGNITGEDQAGDVAVGLDEKSKGQSSLNMTGSASAIDFNNMDDKNFGDFGGEEDSSDDDLYGEAREIIIKAGKASTSYLQRRLKIGYARAARLMDLLEEKGIIGPGDGAKAREVLIKDESVEAIANSSDEVSTDDFGEESA